MAENSGTANAGKSLTLNEALGWKKTLDERYIELSRIRTENSVEERRYIGANADKVIERKPLYDFKNIDRILQALARERRILDLAIKATNASTNVGGYVQDESVLGELS